MGIDVATIMAGEKASLREAITDHFREAIRRGDLAPGEAIPPTRELAALLETSAPNVHHALTPLVREGLITRHRKHGTIVTDRPRQLTCAVVYLHHWKLDILSPFQQALVEYIGKELGERGIEHRVVVDNFTQYGFQQIQDWAQTDRIQGVIMPFAGADTETIAAVGKLPVPSVFMAHSQLVTPSDLPRRPRLVETDGRELSRHVIEALAAQGCRRIGVVSGLARVSGAPPAENSLYTCLRADAAARGLELREEWLAAVAREEEYLATPDAKTRFAYEQCNRLLARTERPDGLFIFCDGLITGALMAIYRRQVRVPDDLKLVVYRNWELDVAGLPPCAMVGLSIADMARSLVQNIVDQYHGHKTSPAPITYQTRSNPGDPI